jgi:multidrug efflux system membrane fusion protein
LKKTKLIPVAILGGLFLIAALIKMNPPDAPQRRGPSGPQMTVETQPVATRNYTVVLESYGTVQPRTRSVLIAQVAGQIVSVNPNVRDGGFFEKGDVLGTIDARDYEADVRISSASLMDSRQTLAEAEARTEQAREDWARLGNSGEPSDLVLRLPQLEAAKARVISAESSLQKSELDLERTNIVAPFAGRILRKLVDVGQVVGTNTQLAEIYATDILEIRLPLRNRDLPYIDLPESYRYEEGIAAAGAEVEIISQLGDAASWEAELVRTESAIDEIARQLHVIAMIDDPFGEQVDDRVPLKIGQYVTARLQGKTIADALVIPNSTIYQGTYVYVVEDGILQRRNIEIAWQNDSEALVGSGLASGDALVVTALGQVTSGIRVSIIGEQPRGPNAGGPNARGPNASGPNASGPNENGEKPNRQRPGASE